MVMKVIRLDIQNHIFPKHPAWFSQLSFYLKSFYLWKLNYFKTLTVIITSGSWLSKSAIRIFIIDIFRFSKWFLSIFTGWSDSPRSQSIILCFAHAWILTIVFNLFWSVGIAMGRKGQKVLIILTNLNTQAHFFPSTPASFFPPRSLSTACFFGGSIRFKKSSLIFFSSVGILLVPKKPKINLVNQTYFSR